MQKEAWLAEQQQLRDQGEDVDPDEEYEEEEYEPPESDHEEDEDEEDLEDGSASLLYLAV